MTVPAILFVANIPSVANAQYIERLFSAYGEVTNVVMRQEGSLVCAEVTFSDVDDADSAIAALHCRYCAYKDLALLVMYHQQSPVVSMYGRMVGREYAAAVAIGRKPHSIPLEAFDDNFERTVVSIPSSCKELFEGPIGSYNDL